MKYNIQPRAILQDYWMPYINEIQHPTKSHFTGLLDVIYEDYEILQIFQSLI